MQSRLTSADGVDTTHTPPPMSLSTLTQCSPHVCARIHNPHTTSAPPILNSGIDWRRVLHVTAVAATATAMSQLVSAPLDAGTHASKALYPYLPRPAVFKALVTVVRQNGLRAAFAGLPLHVMKRIPTKALTVALFELGTQTLHASRSRAARPATRPPLSRFEHVAIAVSSGVAALLATYPIHLSYYAIRKGSTFSTIARCARVQPKIVYSGAIPALFSTAPAVLVDYLMYKTLRRRIDSDTANRSRGANAAAAAAIVAAAAASNLIGGFISEPFKALSRKMAVESVRSASCGSLAVTVRSMMQTGVGEFWRGFPVRSLRYALSAVVSKTTVQQLQRRGSTAGRKGMSFGESSVLLVPAKRCLQACHWQGKTPSYRASSGAVSLYRSI